MQVLINRQLIKSKARIGKLATGVGLGAMAIAFVISFQLAGPLRENDWTLVATSYAVLAIALLSLSVARYHLARWSRRPRADEVLVESLRGFDDKYYLLSYVPGAPVDHLIITPRGLLVLITKHITGEISNRGNRWQRKFSLGQIFGGYSEGGIGNPTLEAGQSVATVKEEVRRVLGAEAEAVPVSAAVVFTNPAAKVRVEDAAVPVIAPDDLRNYVRTVHSDVKVAPSLIDRVAKDFVPDRNRYKEEAVGPKQRKRKPPKIRPQAPPTDMSKMGRNRAERRMK